MKNRTEEYWALVGELSQPPERLEGSVKRAQKRARRERWLRRLAAPVGTLAAAAACFVLVVNAFPTFALACSDLPLLRELAAAAAFSPSLSAAVAHDYVQYIGQSQTIDGVTVNLGYAIVDRAEAVFFYSVDGGRFYTSPGLLDASGEPIGGYGVSSRQNNRDDWDGLSAVTLDFIDGKSLPEHFTMEMYFLPGEELTTEQAARSAPDAPSDGPADSNADEWGDRREDPGVLRFAFDVTLDPSRVVEPILVPVGRWVELDGQRVLVDSLEYSPTRTILRLGEDPANTAWLKDFNFWFEDEKGRKYDDIDGTVSASGTADDGSESMLTYYFQSFYYGQPKGLTLCVGSTEWLDKDAPNVFVDLTTGESSGLFPGMEIAGVTRAGETVRLEVWAPLEGDGFAQAFTSRYWDPEGGEHYCNRMSYATSKEGPDAGSTETFYLDGYPWDTVELEPRYTSRSEYAQPVYVPLTPSP